MSTGMGGSDFFVGSNVRTKDWSRGPEKPEQESRPMTAVEAGEWYYQRHLADIARLEEQRCQQEADNEAIRQRNQRERDRQYQEWRKAAYFKAMDDVKAIFEKYNLSQSQQDKIWETLDAANALWTQNTFDELLARARSEVATLLLANTVRSI